jgi:hypothetical protein
MSDSGWSRAFDDPVPLPDGREVVTLRDAGECITASPPRLQKVPEWKTATRILIAAAEGRDFVMHARIAMLRAFGSGRDLARESRRKTTKK